MGLQSFFSQMNPFASNGFKAKSFGSVDKAIQALQEAIGLTRPISQQTVTGRVFIFPEYGILPEQIYSVAKNSDILRIIQNALKGEIFRNGYELSPAEDTDEEVVVGEDVSKAEDYVDEALSSRTENRSSNAERKEIIDFLERCNNNGQTILDVCKQVEDDINILDDAFVLFLFEYEGEENRKLLEVLRVDPKYMALVMNSQDLPGTDDDGQILMSCPSNRTRLHVIPPELEETAVDPQTGEKLRRVFYKHRGAQSEELYYFEDEIVHLSRYFPSNRLGFSPVITLWEKVQTLMAMDRYVQQLYVGQRPPKGVLVMKTANKEGLSRAWDEMLNTLKKNPHLPGILGIQGSGSSDKGNFAEYFDFMKSLDEMQYVEARNEMRSQIGAFYGVSNVFQNDTSTSGGLNNEGLQITVTNRASERAQTDYNDKLFRKLFKALDKEHWVLRLRPSEEQDEMAKLQRIEMHLKNGGEAAAKGLLARWDAEKGETIIESGEFSPPMSPFGLSSPDSDGNAGGDDSLPISPPNPKPGSSPSGGSSGEPRRERASGSPRENTAKGENFFRSRPRTMISRDSSKRPLSDSSVRKVVTRHSQNFTSLKKR